MTTWRYVMIRKARPYEMIAAGIGSKMRAARRDERVLGRDEERVQQEQACDREELEEESHAPLSGAWVLGGWSSLKGRSSLSIGERPARTSPPRVGIGSTHHPPSA